MSSAALLLAPAAVLHQESAAFFAIHPLFLLPYVAPFCFQYINWRTELSSNLTKANTKISALSTELATTNTNLKTATADSGWKYMTANNLSEKLKFRKIGHVVFVAGSIRFSDNGKFANDQYLGNVPSGMTPNGYNTYECLIPIAMHNGGSAGTQARIYIKNGGVYISGTDSASFVMIAATAYFS